MLWMQLLYWHKVWTLPRHSATWNQVRFCCKYEKCNKWQQSSKHCHRHHQSRFRNWDITNACVYANEQSAAFIQWLHQHYNISIVYRWFDAFTLNFITFISFKKLYDGHDAYDELLIALLWMFDFSMLNATRQLWLHTFQHFSFRIHYIRCYHIR